MRLYGCLCVQNEFSIAGMQTQRRPNVVCEDRANTHIPSFLSLLFSHPLCIYVKSAWGKLLPSQEITASVNSYQNDWVLQEKIGHTTVKATL